VTQRILLIEDDPDLGAQLRRDLGKAGFEVTWVADGDEALSTSLEGMDLVILDLMLPGAYGLDILKKYRLTSEVPVLIVTARDHTADKVRALGLGADDYVTKPFWPEELLARVKARLRRPELKKSDEKVVRAGALEIKESERRVLLSGQAVELSRTELEVLFSLSRRAGRPVERARIAEEALSEDGDGDGRALDVHVSRLRKKLGAEGKRIATVWGIGYRLELDPKESGA
jgi:DNA-binding response OmpR family regulator